MTSPTGSWILLVEPGRNWEIGVEHGIWAVRHGVDVSRGTEIFFWGTEGRGFQGWGLVTSAQRQANNSALPFVDVRENPYLIEFDVRYEDDSLEDAMTWTELKAFLGFKRGANFGPLQLTAPQAAKLRLRLMPSGWTQFGV